MLLNKEISYSSILKMTVPVMFGMMAEYIVYIINAAFLSRVDGDSFVASGNAGLFYVTLMMVGYGIANSAQIVIARRDGENNLEGLGKLMQNNFALLTFVLTIIFIIVQLFGPFIFHLTVASPVIEEKMNSFLSIRSLGIFFSILELGFFAYYTGRGNTLPVMFATIVQGTTNFIFDYGLIFGNLGMPQMGLEGAAWSTAISDSFSGLTYLLFFYFTTKDKSIRKFYKNKITFSEMKQLLMIGLPLMGQGIVSVGSWTVFFFMIEHLGKEEIEISQTIRNFYYICLASVLSFGTTTKTVVSKLIGEGKQDEVKVAMRRIMICSFGFTLVLTHANFLYPNIVVPIINNNPLILDKTVLTLQLVSLAMIMFSASIALTSMIAGAGDTRTSFLIEFISIAFYLIMGWLVTFVFPQPIHIVWCIEYVYFSLMIFLSILYIRKSKWRTIKI